MGAMDCRGVEGLSYREEIAMLATRYLANNYERILDRVFVRAEGSWMFDSTGRRYLDFVSCYSALNVGHGHPKIKQAIIEAAIRGLYAQPQTFLNEWTPKCAEKICQLTGMDKVVFKNGGTEAVEAAMKIARKWGYLRKDIRNNQAEIIFCRNNFHGRTLGALAASTTAQYRDLFGPHLVGIHWTTLGDIEELERAIWSNVAAFIFEPIQGEGGIIVPPAGYLRQVRALCDKHNVLMIADEIQTGFGRTGKMFACDWEDVRPDIYILGKALGGGIAISAVAGKEFAMDVLVPKDDGSTFGGSPFASAVALAAMGIIEEESLALKAAVSGAYLVSKLNWIAKRSKFIKEIRGRGLLLGIELAEGAPPAKRIMRELLDLGVIVNDTKPHVIRIAPPLNISLKDLGFGIECLDKVFTKTNW